MAGSEGVPRRDEDGAAGMATAKDAAPLQGDLPGVGTRGRLATTNYVVILIPQWGDARDGFIRCGKMRKDKKILI